MTDEFEGKPLLARHRMVNALFAAEMTGKTPIMHGEINHASSCSTASYDIDGVCRLRWTLVSLAQCVFRMITACAAGSIL